MIKIKMIKMIKMMKMNQNDKHQMNMTMMMIMVSMRMVGGFRPHGFAGISHSRASREPV